jgi:hypothetical protein
VPYFNDLESYVTAIDKNPLVLTVGWLDASHAFANGSIDASCLERLKALERMPWEPYYTTGMHFCELCPQKKAAGTQTIWIPGEHCVFVSPTLVTHYIDTHHYRPPEEYISSVIGCPPMHSDEYFAKLAKHGVIGSAPPWASSKR